MDKDPDGLSTHAFIVKIWLEEPAASRRPARWRGQITHVPSGRRGYMQRLGAIAEFISPYLEAMGVRPALVSRVRRQVSRLIMRVRGW